MFAKLLNKTVDQGKEQPSLTKKSKWDKILSDMNQETAEEDQEQERFESLLLMFRHLEPAIEQDEVLSDLTVHEDQLSSDPTSEFSGDGHLAKAQRANSGHPSRSRTPGSKPASQLSKTSSVGVLGRDDIPLRSKTKANNKILTPGRNEKNVSPTMIGGSAEDQTLSQAVVGHKIALQDDIEESKSQGVNDKHKQSKQQISSEQGLLEQSQQSEEKITIHTHTCSDSGAIEVAGKKESTSGISQKEHDNSDEQDDKVLELLPPDPALGLIKHETASQVNRKFQKLQSQAEDAHCFQHMGGFGSNAPRTRQEGAFSLHTKDELAAAKRTSTLDPQKAKLKKMVSLEQHDHQAGPSGSSDAFSRTATFHQEKRKLKTGVTLNQNDIDIVQLLKDRLINFMHLDAYQQKGVLQKIKNKDEEPQPQATSLDLRRTTLLKKKESSAQVDKQQQSDRTVHSQTGKQPEAMDFSATFITASPQFNEDIKDVTTPKAQIKKMFGTEIRPKKEQQCVEDYQMNFVEKLKFLQQFTGKTKPDIKKRQMIRQLDKLTDANKSKEQQLVELQMELLQYQKERKRERETTKKVKKDIEGRMMQFESPDRIYRDRIEEQIMDIKAQKHTFDYTNIDSMIERKEVLLSKLQILLPRQREQERQHFQYTQMIGQLYRRNRIEDKKNQIDISQKNFNIDGILNELTDLQMVENTRALQIENMVFKYRKKMEDDHQEMENLLAERKIVLQNNETDAQQIIYKLLQHMRQIKRLLNHLSKLKSKREQNYLIEKQIIEAYQCREQEIDIIGKMSILKEIKLYSAQLDQVALDVELSEDQIRVKGLELISDLKYKIEQVKIPPQYTGEASACRHGKTLTPSPQRKGNLLYNRSNSKSPSSIQGQKVNNHQQLLHKIENYVQNKQQYDQYYKKENLKIEDLEFNFILEIYLMSNIKLNSLKEAHQNHSNEKQAKMLKIIQLNQYLAQCRNEKKTIGDYINKMDKGTVAASLKGPLSCEGMQILIEEIKRKNKGTVLATKVVNDNCRYFQFGIYSQIVQLIQRLMYLKGNIKIRNTDFDKYLTMPHLADLFEAYQPQQKQGPNTAKRGARRSRKSQFGNTSNKKKLVVNKPQTRRESSKDSKSQKSSFCEDSDVADGGEEQDPALSAGQTPGETTVVTNRTKETNKELNLFYREKDDADSAKSSKSHVFEDSSDNKTPIDADTGQASSKAPGDLASINLNPVANTVGSNQSGITLHSGSAKSDQVINNLQEFQQSLFNDMTKMILFLRESRETQGLSMPLLKKGVVRPKNMLGAGAQSFENCSVGLMVNIADFDPVHRRKDFKYIKANVLNELDLKKSYTQQQFRQMKLDAKQRHARMGEPDKEQIEFAKYDPREKKIDQEQLKNAAMRDKLKKLREYKVKESLWRKDLSPDEVDKHDLNRQRHKLMELPRQEQNFIENLKEKIEGRYDRLKKSFIREYRLKPNKAQPEGSSTTENYDFSIIQKMSKKGDPNKVGHVLESAVGMFLGQQLASEVQYLKEVKQAELDQSIKPVSSPCFGCQRPKAPASSSLKERIKLNKILTQSSRAGGRLGMPSTKKKTKLDVDELIYTPGMGKTIQPRTAKSGIALRQKFETLKAKGTTSNLIGRNQSKYVNPNFQGQYTSNQGFNMTYRTIDTKNALLSPQFNRSAFSHRAQQIAQEYLSMRGSETKKSNFSPDSSTQINSKVDIFNKFFVQRGSNSIYNEEVRSKLRQNKSAAHVGARQNKGIALRQNLTKGSPNQAQFGSVRSNNILDAATQPSGPVSIDKNNKNLSMKTLSVVDLEVNKDL